MSKLLSFPRKVASRRFFALIDSFHFLSLFCVRSLVSLASVSFSTKNYQTSGQRAHGVYFHHYFFAFVLFACGLVSSSQFYGSGICRDFVCVSRYIFDFSLKMPWRCVVGGCSKTNNDGVSLQYYPIDDLLRRVWTARVNWRSLVPRGIRRVPVGGHLQLPFPPRWCFWERVACIHSLGFAVKGGTSPMLFPSIIKRQS